jgi:hypothetical protein
MSKNTRKEKSARSISKKQERKFAAESAIATQELADKVMQDANKSAQEAAASFGGGTGVNFNAAPTNVERASEKLRNEANAPKAINVGTPVLPALRATNENTVKSEIPSVSVPGGVSVETPSTATIEKPKSFADVLADRYAEMRKTAEKEKTDAAKMQKYYALTDALRAIGQLGGTAVGGAIGGDLPDSAPAVDPYKESRGYLDAFERAKKANDRIKELDEKGFSLALRDEQRAYDQAMREEDRAYKEKLDALDKQWQKDFYDYRSKIDQAIAQGNMELQAKLREEQEAREQEYWKERNAITQQHDINMKAWSERIVNKQMGLDANGNPKEDGVDFAFYDDNVKPTKIPAKRYKEMLAHYASMGKIGDTVVDEENVVSILKSNPQLVKSFLAKYGEGGDIVIPEKQAYVVEEEDSTPTNRTFEEVNAEDLSARKRRKEERKNTSKVQPYSTSADFIKAAINGSMQKRSNDGTQSEPYIDEFGGEWE